MRRVWMLAIIVGLVGPVAPSAHAADVFVSVEDGRYEVYGSAPAGAVVRFRWSDNNWEPHSVTTYDGQSFDSGLRVNGSMDVTFEGTTTLFRCELHSTLDDQGRCDGMCGVLEDDTVAPSPPTITAPTPEQVVGSSAVTIAGTADPDAEWVLVRIDDSIYGWAPVSDGGWSLVTRLDQGPHTIGVTAWDRYSNVSGSVTLSFSVNDITPPAQPVFIEPADGSIVQHLAQAMVQVDDETARVVFSSEDPPFETWAWPRDGIASMPLHEAGAYTLRARAYDYVGNASEAASVNVVVDATPPTVTVAQPSSPSVSHGPPLISGTAGDDVEVATVAITVIDRTRSTIDNVQADCDGCGSTEATWQLLVPLAPGWYTLSAVATDGVGHQVESSTRHVLVL